MGKRLNVQISIISHTLTFLCFHRELWTKSESQPNTCQVEKRSSVWRLLKWSPFVYSFPLFLGCTGEISCRLGNGAKAELLLFKLAAAPSVCTCRSATDRVTLPQKLSIFVSFSHLVKYFHFTLSAHTCHYVSLFKKTWSLFFFSYIYPHCHLSLQFLVNFFCSYPSFLSQCFFFSVVSYISRSCSLLISFFLSVFFLKLCLGFHFLFH